MARKSPKVDAYIARAEPFARPILMKIRSLFHRASPKIEETIKWGVPHFEYKGVLGGMAGFKKHATWGFWKAKLLNDPRGVMRSDAGSAMGGGKPTDVSQLPPDEAILDLIKQAIALNEQGVKIQRTKPSRRPPPKIPPILAAALKKNPKAAAAFKAFSSSHQREYIEWITDAKQDQTRQRRLAQAIEWMAKGKPRHWKYVNY